MTDGAVGQFELTRTPTLTETPANIVHNTALATGTLFPVLQYHARTSAPAIAAEI